MKEKNCAVILAAGSGKRMQSNVPKQYMMLGDKPVLWYSLRVFEQFGEVQDVFVVARKEEIAYCTEEFVNRYGFSKVREVIPGGEERFHSVWNALVKADDYQYVMIHDGARPLADLSLLERNLACARKYGAAAAGVPVKDTIKQCDQNGMVTCTPDRAGLWAVQTPQSFSLPLVKKAYEQMWKSSYSTITDDAMVVERFAGHPVMMSEGSYRNIKITTGEDILIAEAFLKADQAGNRNEK